MLINEYLRGQGIMLHRDGPLYSPRVGIVSLGDTVVMNLEPPQSSMQPTLQIVLRPGSLLVFEHDVYESFLHGIAETDHDVITEHCLNHTSLGLEVGDHVLRGERRVSLTVRRVLKCAGGGQ